MWDGNTLIAALTNAVAVVEREPMWDGNDQHRGPPRLDTAR